MGQQHTCQDIELPMRLNDRTLRHTFAILPTLQDDILVGVDLWQRLGLTLPPPKNVTTQSGIPACGVAGGLRESSEDEKQKLKEFLELELPRFEPVTSPTPIPEHAISLTKT